MNDRQLDRIKKELRDEMKAKGFGWIDGKFYKPPKEYEIRQQELSCIDMINSILCYNCKGMTDAIEVLEHEEKSHYNYLADYVTKLGREKVIELIQGQIDSIDSVKMNIYTDSDGLSYSSIIWKEE